MNRILPGEISSRILRAANYAIVKRMGVTVTVGGTIKIPAINDSIGQAHILRNIGKELNPVLVQAIILYPTVGAVNFKTPASPGMKKDEFFDKTLLKEAPFCRMKKQSKTALSSKNLTYEVETILCLKFCLGKCYTIPCQVRS